MGLQHVLQGTRSISKNAGCYLHAENQHTLTCISASQSCSCRCQLVVPHELILHPTLKRLHLKVGRVSYDREPSPVNLHMHRLLGHCHRTEARALYA